MATKKIKIKEEAISEILDADNNSESGAEASDVEDELEVEEEEEAQEDSGSGDSDDDNDNNNKPQQNTKHRLQHVAENYQPGDCLKQGTQIFIIISI